MKWFESDKTITELGIDTTRKFIMLEGYEDLSRWDIVTFCADDDTDCPAFTDSNWGRQYVYLYMLAYYEGEFKDWEEVELTQWTHKVVRMYRGKTEFWTYIWENQETWDIDFYDSCSKIEKEETKVPKYKIGDKVQSYQWGYIDYFMIVNINYDWTEFTYNDLKEKDIQEVPEEEISLYFKN